MSVALQMCISRENINIRVVGIASSSCAMVRKLLRACVGARNFLNPSHVLASPMLMYEMCALQRAERLAGRRLGLCILLLAL